MSWKPKDWVEHPTFGVGQVVGDRDDKLDIRFVTAGSRTLLNSTALVPASAPGPNFKFPSDGTRSRSSQVKVQRPPKKPALDFDHLVSCFRSRFPAGFDDPEFQLEERGYKEDAGRLLKEKLGQETFENLLHEEHYAEICEIAKQVLRSTNLPYPIEKAKLVDGIENSANQKPFANALYDLLYGTAEMQSRFTVFIDVLANMDANKWPLATYYQFLASDGKWMFMKPSIMKRMADSLKIALNYKAEPNWLTYLKLQELADRVDSELRKRELTPRSRMDVQGFIWASFSIEEGKYGARE